MCDAEGILQTTPDAMAHRLVHMPERMNLRESANQAPHPEVTIPEMSSAFGTRDGERSALEGGRRLIVGCDGMFLCTQSNFSCENRASSALQISDF